MKSKLKETDKVKHLQTKIQNEGNKYISNILGSFFQVFFSVWEQESVVHSVEFECINALLKFEYVDIPHFIVI